MTAITEQQIWQMMTDGTPIVVTSHARLDGDALGSSLALWHALKEQGVPCYHIYEPPLPEVFEFLPGLEEAVESTEALPDRFNLVVTDCGTLEMVGGIVEGLKDKGRVFNIDHHLTNDYFGDINLVEHAASSCGELIYRVLQRNDVPVSQQVAECLYAAILTDTGRFSYHNTTPEALRICGELVRAGADPTELTEKIYFSPTAAQVVLKGMAIRTLSFEDEGKIAVVKITEEMFRRAGIGPVDTQGFADIPAAIRGVQVGVLLKEMPGCDFIKVSLRSRNLVDVCAVARHFQGGGHAHAAGCEMKSTIEEAQRAVVEIVRRELQKAART